MKRILLILTILAISLTTVGQAPSYQTAVIHANPTTLQGGIVRPWTANSAVTYFRDGNTHYFAVISEGSPTIDAIKFDNDTFYVNDLFVLGDSLYYCGIKGGDGVIGCFKISNILGVLPPFNTDEKIFDSLVSVNKLVAYYQPGNQYAHVAAIGEKRYSVEPYIHLRTYMIDVCFGPGPFDYSEMAPAYESTEDTRQGERLYDVVATDKYIAFVGIITNSSFLSIRKCDKSGVLTTPTCRNYYIYDLPAQGVPFAAAMEGDKIATAQECIIINQVENATHVRLFDLQTMNMYSAQSMRSSYKSFINDLTYMPYDKTLLLVHVDQNGSNPDHRVVYFRPTTPTPYLTHAVTDANHGSLSYIETFKSQFFIVGDGDIIMSHFRPNVASNNRCIDVSLREIEKLQTVPFLKKEYYNVLAVEESNSTPFLPTALNYSVDCIH